MLVINLMIIVLLIYSIVLLSGVKIMFNRRYIQLIISIFIMYNPISSLIEGYKLGYTVISSIIIVTILFLLLFIWGYRRNKYMYLIHNVKKSDVVNIIEKYLETKNIKYEVKDEEIYLPELYKSIFVKGLTGIHLDCIEIKDFDFYNELIDNVKTCIKEIKQRYFSIEGIFYLIFAVSLYLLVDFLK